MGSSSPYIFAVFIMSVGMACISLGDTAGKMLVSHFAVAPFFIAWTRFGIGALLIIPFVIWRKFNIKMFVDWRIILRAGLITAGISSILMALTTVDMATVFGAFYIGPIVAYFGAAWVLKEPIDTIRSVLLFIGFCGVFLVVKPGFGMELGTGFALLAGVFYGAFLIANRWLADVAAPNDLLFSQLAIGAVVLLPLGLTDLPQLALPIIWHDFWQLSGLIVASAGFSLLGNLFLLLALSRSSASSLAPVIYFQLIFVTMLGYLVFGDVPDILTLVGLAVLIISGLAALFFVRGARQSRA